jgi:uncharacterized damage-inducible protein DinB
MKATLIKLLDYELWANRRVIERLQSITTPVERAVQLMAHILSVQDVWFNRITGCDTEVVIWQVIPVEAMNQKAEDHHKLLSAYLANLTNEQLLQAIIYRTSKGQSFKNSLLDILLHLSHHAAYHRGQVIQLIRPQLVETPYTDYILWIRE